MRILLIAHDFPPLNSSAARRPYSWAATWAAGGHDVCVVTTVKYRFDGHIGLDLPCTDFELREVAYLPEHYRLVTTGNSAGGKVVQPSVFYQFARWATRRLRLGLGLMTQTPMLALRPMLRACLEEHRRKPFDVVISTSGPEVCTFVAHAFIRRTGIPWVADYRDLWFQEFAIQRFAFTTWLTGTLNKRMLRRASAVVTVSDGLAGYLTPIVQCPVWVCYNGFLEKPAGGERPWNDDRFHIVYTGNFYPEKRDPRALFVALAMLFAKKPALRDRFRLDIYGPPEEWVRDQVRAAGIDDVVVDHGMQPYSVSLRAQSCADALLFVDWMDLTAKGVLTGKLFEYLAAGRPIVNIAASADTEASKVISNAGAGEALTDVDSIQRVLVALLTNKLSTSIDPAMIERYSRRAQSVVLLDRIATLVGAQSRKGDKLEHAPA